ncbi:MAG: class I SAM-dependent RNA methyltransferase [Alphaproteobacteria bacterium]
MADEVTVEVETLGPRGDGIAKNPGGGARGRLYIAGALPDERVRVRPGNKRGDGLEAKLLEIITPSDDRAAPPCRHFATCGGCSVQHLGVDAYRAWKRELVVAAIERLGFDREIVAPLVATESNGRRRATFAAFRPRAKDSKTFFGFHTRASRHVVELEECLILHPELMALVPKLRQVLADIVPPGARWDVSVTRADNGFDVLIVAAHEPGPDASMALAMFADAEGLARIAWQLEGRSRDEIEPVALHRMPVLELSGVPVEIPPGVFLQASAEAEGILAGLVVEASQGLRVADLYCGVGTFALPLAAAGASVMAVDGDDAAIAALAHAAGTAGFGGQVMAEARDLVRRPMAAEEFRRIETIVFDPPRAGAAAQAAEIAQTDATRVVAVSCNPTTFARDARALVGGGYTLERITPVDQFVWTGHVELVAVFSK